MKDKPFVDTNVFFYSVDSAQPSKQKRARELLRSIAADRNGVVSSQVVLELATNLVKKMSLTPSEVAGRLRVVDGLECVSINPDLVRDALRLQGKSSLSVWDAAILAAAVQAKCRVLYTEDLQHGQTIEGVRIVNPFI